MSSTLRPAAFCAPLPLTARSFAVSRAAIRLRPATTARRRRARIQCGLRWIDTRPLAQRQLDRLSRAVPLAFRSPNSTLLAVIGLSVLFALIWALTVRRKNAHIRLLQLAAAASARRPMAIFEDQDFDEAGSDNALWLNLSLFPSAWRLFRKNTATLISDTLQPILDAVELPDFIARVEIHALRLGNRPPLVRNIKRLPSRARSELQYSFVGRLVGDLQIDLMVFLKLPLLDKSLKCPVTVTDLDVDSNVWCGFSLMPAAPFVRRVQWALLKLPTVKLNLKVARVLPVTAIPLLSSVLSVLFTKTIPKEFLLPRTQIIDLAQDAAGTSSQANSSSFDLADTLTVTLDGEISSMGLDFEELKLQYPALWALFDSMDTSEPYGELSVEEVVEGLSCDWGFASTSEQDKRALFNLLDENDDGVVSFAEFVSAWPDLRSVFVPRRFDGVIAGVLQKGKDLPVPKYGWSDPYVVLKVEGESVSSMKNYETSKRGKLPSDAVWNEGWELEVENPSTAVLHVELREGSPFAFGFPNPHAIAPAPGSKVGKAIPNEPGQGAREGRLLGTGRVRVEKLQNGRSMKLWVTLGPRGGAILLDMNYARYVEARPL